MVGARGVKFPHLVAAHAAFPSQRTLSLRSKKMDGACAPSSPRLRRAPNLHSIIRARTWREQNQILIGNKSSIVSNPNNNKSVSQRTALPVLITEPFVELPVFVIIMTTLCIYLLSVHVISLVSGGLRCVRDRLVLLYSPPPPYRDHNFLRGTTFAGGFAEDESNKLCSKCRIVI